MVEGAEMRNRPMFLPALAGLGAEHALGLPGGVATGLGAYAAMSPELQSRLAVALFNAPPWAIQQSPMAMAALARAFMAPPDTTQK